MQRGSTIGVRRKRSKMRFEGVGIGKVAKVKVKVTKATRLLLIKRYLTRYYMVPRRVLMLKH